MILYREVTSYAPREHQNPDAGVCGPQHVLLDDAGIGRRVWSKLRVEVSANVSSGGVVLPLWPPLGFACVPMLNEFMVPVNPTYFRIKVKGPIPRVVEGVYP